MKYEPLHEMITTGPARLDNEGCLIESGEYTAALYESYMADMEPNRTYAVTAELLAENIWQQDIESVIPD